MLAHEVDALGLHMGKAAVLAALDALVGVDEIAAALVSQGVEGTVAKGTVEVLGADSLVAGEMGTLGVGEEGKDLFAGHGNSVSFKAMGRRQRPRILHGKGDVT